MWPEGKWVRGEVGLDKVEVVGGYQITKALEKARTLSYGKHPLSNTHFIPVCFIHDRPQ